MPSRDAKNSNDAKEARDERARKRQRTRKQLERDNLRKEKEEAEAAQQQLKDFELWKSMRSRSINLQCALEKAADAVVCQIFAFLTAREHWNLSRTSCRIEAVSRLPKASPITIEITAEMDRKVIERLVKFRPTYLTLTPDTDNSWMETEKMPQLRELTFDEEYFQSGERDDRNTQWISELTSLTKLKISDHYFIKLRPLLSDSLLHLHLFGYSDEGFCQFDSTEFLRCATLFNLQTLKLPRNRYYGKEMLKLGTKFPLLREFSFGHLNGGNREHFDLMELASAINLESLTMGVDCDETTCHWESLAAFGALRRLTICIYQRTLPGQTIPGTLFDGLAKVGQLTHLKLVPDGRGNSIDISNAVGGLAIELTTSDTDNSTKDAQKDTSTTSFPPRLTSLLIDDNFRCLSASCLSSLTTLTELQLPRDTHYFPHLSCFPLLRTLHTKSVEVGRDNTMERYKEQICCVVLKDFPKCPDTYTAATLRTLLTMPQLTTLKLHPQLTFTTSTPKTTTSSATGGSNAISIHTYFRRHLPLTVQIETDDSAECY